MTCPHCQTANPDEARYCHHCGAPFAGSDLFPNPAAPYPPSDRGFLFLAVLYFVNAADVLCWAFWWKKNLSHPILAQAWVSLIGLLLNCAEVVLMVSFTRRPRYRTFILLLAGCFIMAEVVLLFPLLRRLFHS